MIVSDIQTRVKRQFGDEAGVQLTDDDIIRFINDGMRQMVASNENLLQKVATASAVANQQDYTLPADCLILQGISYRGPSDSSYLKLKYLSLNEFNEYIDGWDGTQYGNSTPLVYMVFGSTVSFFPKPDQDAANAIKLYYNRVPANVTIAADTPDIPVLYHEVLVKYCLAQAYEMDEDFDAAVMKNQQIQGDMTVLRGRDSWKNQEFYSTITVLNEDL